MNPPCAKCKKTVYPVEKLNCLDKVWHKACFSCMECGLKLTMKTYKGYNKFPYCNTHYPTTRFTQVADTPENKRLHQQSIAQSQVQYQKDFKNSLRDFHQVSDSVAQQQMAHASGLASNTAYRTAPHDVQGIGQTEPQGYNHPPPMSYTQPPQPSYNPPQPSYNPPQPSYNPPQPSYNPPQPSYNPPQPSYNPPQPLAHIPAPQPTYPSQPKPRAPAPSGPRYVAMFDYTAADDDEVSFREGDIIVEPNEIDDGWMEGRVERTGQFGMLPSNYVERV